MTASTQLPPSPKPTSNRNNHTLLIVLLSVGLVSMLCCGGGLCGGLLFFVGSSKTTLARVKATIENKVEPIVNPNFNEDWMIRQQLTRAYTTSLDAVAADKQVIERLGEPIEAASEPDALFRREGAGAFSLEEETIEFDVKGPKAAAVVRALCAKDEAPKFSYPWSRAQKITVTLSDGSEIDVAPQIPSP